MMNSPWDRKFDRNYVDAMTAAALFLLRRKNCDIYYPAPSNLGVNFCRYIHLPTHKFSLQKEQQLSLMSIDPLIEQYLPIVWGLTAKIHSSNFPHH